MYVSILFGNRDSSKIKDRNIKTTAMWMSGLVARYLFSFILMKMRIG